MLNYIECRERGTFFVNQEYTEDFYMETKFSVAKITTVFYRLQQRANLRSHPCIF